MLDDILLNLITIWSGQRNYPTEEKINHNIKSLRNEQWFQPLFSEHTALFLESRELRFFIGAASLQTILNNPKKIQRFEEDLIHFINLIRKKHK